MSIGTPPSPYAFVKRDRRAILEQLLDAVPEARASFEDGRVPDALRLLREAKGVKLSRSIGVTKEGFLHLIANDMPNKYSV